MDLDGEEAFEVSLITLVIFEGGEVDTIDVDLDTIAPAFDEVVIPVIGFGEAGERGRLGKGD